MKAFFLKEVFLLLPVVPVLLDGICEHFFWASRKPYFLPNPLNSVPLHHVSEYITFPTSSK